MTVDLLRFPIGQFEPNLSPTQQDRQQLIQQLSGISDELRDLIRSLTPEQLKVPYRTDGWCIQQIIHHMADNDMNASIRLRRALTEEQPVASSYRENLFAELSDYNDAPIELSILLLEALHKRIVIVLSNLEEEKFQRTLQTGLLGIITIDTAMQRLVWHNRHHMAQIQSLIERMGWRMEVKQS